MQLNITVENLNYEQYKLYECMLDGFIKELILLGCTVKLEESED